MHAANDYAFRWACARGHLEVVKVLLDAGADLHAQEDFALRNAVKLRRTEVVKFLLEKGAYINANDNEAAKEVKRNGHAAMKQLFASHIEATTQLPLLPSQSQSFTNIE